MRPRIRSAIDSALESPGASVVACANFGYGKTSSLAEWAHASKRANRCVAWLALDQYDNDAGSFLGYLKASLDEALPRPVSMPAEYANSTNCSPNMIAAILFEDMWELNCEVILCLDDFQEIEGGYVSDLIEILATGAPDWFHTVIASRKMPSFCTPGMIASGHAFLIEQSDLCFDEEELSVFLRSVLATSPNKHQLSQIATRTEGWPLAARLETFSFASSESETQSASFSLCRKSEPMSKTLFASLLANMEDEIRNYLMIASFFDNFCHSLIFHVLPEGIIVEKDGESSLNKLMEEGMFITCLEAHGGEPWFRLHALFKEELQRQAFIALSEDERHLINRKAALWLQREGEFSAMMLHALDTKDPDFAASCLNIACLKVSHEAPKGPQFDIDRWMSLIPRKCLSRYPIIHIANALNQALSDFDGCKPLIESVIHSLPTEDDMSNQQYGTEASGMAGLLKLVYAVAGGGAEGDFSSQPTIDHIVRCLPDPDPLSARLHQMISYLLIAKNDIRRAFDELDHAQRISDAQPIGILGAHLMGNRVDLLIRTGRLKDASNYAHEGLEILPKRNWIMLASSLVAEQARISLYQGDTQEALKLITAQNDHQERSFRSLLCHEIETWAYIVEGKFEKAASMQKSDAKGNRDSPKGSLELHRAPFRRQTDAITPDRQHQLHPKLGYRSTWQPVIWIGDQALLCGLYRRELSCFRGSRSRRHRHRLLH